MGILKKGLLCAAGSCALWLNAFSAAALGGSINPAQQLEVPSSPLIWAAAHSRRPHRASNVASPDTSVIEDEPPVVKAEAPAIFEEQPVVAVREAPIIAPHDSAYSYPAFAYEALVSGNSWNGYGYGYGRGWGGYRHW